MSADEKLLTGSCHCGFIRYTITLPASQLENPTASRCNCTMCHKPSFTSLEVPDPSTNFKLVSPSSKTELPDYQLSNKHQHRYFCNKCGVQVLSEGSYEYEGTVYPYFAVNLHSVDQMQEGFDACKFKFKYWDGLHDNWQAGLKDEPFPGGCT